MPAARLFAALLLATLGAACAPLQIAPAPLAEPTPGAAFLAEALQALPLDPPLAAPQGAMPSPLGGSSHCGGDAGEQARAQCLRGEGWDTAPAH